MTYIQFYCNRNLKREKENKNRVCITTIRAKDSSWKAEMMWHQFSIAETLYYSKKGGHHCASLLQFVCGDDIHLGTPSGSWRSESKKNSIFPF